MYDCVLVLAGNAARLHHHHHHPFGVALAKVDKLSVIDDTYRAEAVGTRLGRSGGSGIISPASATRWVEGLITPDPDLKGKRGSGLVIMEI